MEQEQAAKILAKKLADENHIFVLDTLSANHYVKSNAKIRFPLIRERRSSKMEFTGHAFCQNGRILTKPRYPDNIEGYGNFGGASEQAITQENKPHLNKIVDFEVRNIIIQHAAEEAKKIGANYMIATGLHVIDRSLSEKKSSADAEPYIIIGPPEFDILKEMYKGDYYGQTKEAIHTLEFEKELEINYNQLALKEPKKFCEYFPQVRPQKKKEILRGMFVSYDLEDKIDITVKQFLQSPTYKDIMKDVMRDKLTRFEK